MKNRKEMPTNRELNLLTYFFIRKNLLVPLDQILDSLMCALNAES